MNVERFMGKHVLITGGAAGLGRVIARRFATEGANAFVIDRDPASEVVTELERMSASGIIPLRRY